MGIIKNSVEKNALKLHHSKIKKNEIHRLVNLAKNENNFAARDIIVYNFFEKIHNLLVFKFICSYSSWTPIEKNDLLTITFLAIDSAIKAFVDTKKVPFDYYVKLHSILFLSSYVKKLNSKSQYILNKCANSKDYEETNIEKFLVDQTMTTPIKYAKQQICFEEIKKTISNLSKIKKDAILLRLQGYTFSSIENLLSIKQKQLEYLLKKIREQLYKAGIDNI